MEKDFCLVYRVEHKTRKTKRYYFGPYCEDSVSNIYVWSKRPHSGANHPNPYSDCSIFSSNKNCGFSSLTQLNDWFNSYEIKQLKKMGYKIVIYKVKNKNVLFGKKQVMFKIPKTKRRKFVNI